ncbi:MAG: ribose 5-phosphate isomerase B [Parcubacteria group bacterium Gr01-1014_18]|nr:MAG: ribose 5-phosphate isomerase B [Parcubacteria group bacterium Greene0416_36]TSC80210.1 MAG: ribose 5-phosphate isomerase B [Parcubacteria group bacterium Gr01-1014_18]TSC98392.1 MAG: ribose 5-phosphate isomerase B [Parcubacteria group bacterium Greene1014_20]TSD06933.1 MAG: ribose 5-phosphate isomerase B [Parcubacteria group bacterium Greene0714_2]
MIFLGSDHAGFRLKESLKPYLQELGVAFMDLGNHSYDPTDDYPDYGYRVAQHVMQSNDPVDRGLLFCGNAEGICIVANKVGGIRAAIGYNEYAARTTRTDDDSNILCLPGRVLTAEEARKIILVWLQTPFSGETRHVRRLDKIKQIEKKEIPSVSENIYEN